MAFPGVVLAFAIGVPLIINNVSPEILDELRQDVLEWYQSFMPDDDALNAADNAKLMFEGIFKVGLAIFLINALIISWISFSITQWIVGKLKQKQEYVSSLQSFKLPFHAIWLFLISFGLLLTEYKPIFPLALNIFIIFAFLYLIQGLAIIMYFMHNYSIGRLPRVLFWLIFFITLIFSVIVLIFTGIIDNWFNFRSLAEERNKNNK